MQEPINDEIWISPAIDPYEDDCILFKKPTYYNIDRFKFVRVVLFVEYEALKKENETLKEQLKKVQDLIR